MLIPFKSGKHTWKAWRTFRSMKAVFTRHLFMKRLRKFPMATVSPCYLKLEHFTIPTCNKRVGDCVKLWLNFSLFIWVSLPFRCFAFGAMLQHLFACCCSIIRQTYIYESINPPASPQKTPPATGGARRRIRFFRCKFNRTFLLLVGIAFRCLRFRLLLNTPKEIWLAWCWSRSIRCEQMPSILLFDCFKI